MLIFKNRTVLRRVLITIGVVLFTRLIYFSPLPGVDVKAVVDIFQRQIQSQGGRWFDLVSLVHLGKLRNISLFALGILPYINACIIVQIIGFLVPGINREFFYEKNGHHNMLKTTLLFTFVLSAIYAHSISVDLGLLNESADFTILNFQGIIFRLSATFTMTAAVAFLLFLAQIINRFGLGNGIGIIFASEVLVRLIFAIDQLILFYMRRLIQLRQLFIFVGIFIIFIYLARFITRYTKKVELYTHENKKFSILVRPNWIGVWPLIITEVIFSFFKIQLGWSMFLLVPLVILVFTLCYVKIVYQPRRFYEFILKYKCGAKSDKKRRIEDILNHAVLKCVGFACMLFLVMYYLPLLLPLATGISFISAGIFGTFGIIILVGVYYDMMQQLEFFEKTEQSAASNWRLFNIAYDEPEAEIKKACLASHGIMAEIKPYHFNWGLPIKTAVSNYQIFVPAQKLKEANQVFEELKVVWQGREI